MFLVLWRVGQKSEEEGRHRVIRLQAGAARLHVVVPLDEARLQHTKYHGLFLPAVTPLTRNGETRIRRAGIDVAAFVTDLLVSIYFKQSYTPTLTSRY